MGLLLLGPVLLQTSRPRPIVIIALREPGGGEDVTEHPLPLIAEIGSVRPFTLRHLLEKAFEGFRGLFNARNWWSLATSDPGPCRRCEFPVAAIVSRDRISLVEL